MSTRGAPAWTRPRSPQATTSGLPRDRAGAARRAVVRRRDRPGRGAGQGQQARPTRLVGDRGPGAQRRALAALGSRECLPVISFGLALTPPKPRAASGLVNERYRVVARGVSGLTYPRCCLRTRLEYSVSLADPWSNFETISNHLGPRRVALDLPALIGRLVGSVTATSPAGRFGWLTCRRCPQCRLPLRSSSCWRCSTSGTARWRSVTG